MNKIILDYNEEENLYFESIKWWENKRKIYNIVIFLTLIIPLKYLFSEYVNQNASEFSFIYLIDIIFWLIGANLLYCLGFGVELTAQYYRKKKSKNIRNLLFYSGLIFSIVWSLFSSTF